MKRLIPVLLTLLATGALSGCGDGGSAAAAPATTPPPPAATPPPPAVITGITTPKSVAVVTAN